MGLPHYFMVGIVTFQTVFFVQALSSIFIKRIVLPAMKLIAKGVKMQQQAARNVVNVNKKSQMVSLKYK